MYLRVEKKKKNNSFQKRRIWVREKNIDKFSSISPFVACIHHAPDDLLIFGRSIGWEASILEVVSDVVEP